MTDRTKTILRWIFFVPLSILASESIRYLLNLMGGGTLEVLFPLLGQTVSGIITWTIGGVTLIYTAHFIIPNHRIKALKIYTLIWSAIIICWTIFVYYLAEKGLAGSFWFPFLINTSFFIGIWISYLRTTSRHSGE